MAYDAALAKRVRGALSKTRGVEERAMFGGLAFMVRGNMCCGVLDDRIMLRVGDRYDDLIGESHVRPMDFTGKPLRGFVYVEAPGIRTPAGLKRWVGVALEFATTLPAKKRKRRPGAPRRKSRR